MRPDTNRYGGEADRAVSEVVGFVLVFGIIITSVGLLYLTGFQTMGAYQESEQLRNAEHGMEALAGGFNDVVRYDATRERSSELALRGGTLQTAEGTNVTITNDGSGVWNDSLGALVYEYEDTAISYEGGGVFRNESGGDVAVSSPRVTCTDETAIVSLVVIDDGPGSIQTDGSTEIAIVEDRSASRAVSETYDADDIEIEVDGSTHQNGWESALERNGWSGADGTYTCDGVERVHVDIVVVDVEY